VSRAVCALCLLVALAVGVAGCGGGDTASESTAGEESTAAEVPPPKNQSAADQKPKKGAWGVVFAAEGEPLGLILYDLSGHTLYTFSNDEGGTSSCYDACAKTWPPALTEGKPRAKGVPPSKVGTAKRKDGTIQLTYAGHPLYTYADDKSSEVNGNGVHAFGGRWYAIRPNGEKPGG
jgi:predicted lipoprotein with Yx(FWY)xxD motif